MGKMCEFFKAGISCLTTMPKFFWGKEIKKILNRECNQKEVSILMRCKRVRNLYQDKQEGVVGYN